jgi:hypothetical protein
MADDYSLLSDCGDRLPVATVVDSIPFYRIVPLEIASGGVSHPAIYPVDYAVPELVQEGVLQGWPPEDIVSARGGIPLVSEWDAPAADSIVEESITVEIEDIDAFIADPSVTLEGEELAVALDPFNIEVLLAGGTTLVRTEDGRPVFIQPGGPSVLGEEVVISDLSEIARGGLIFGAERLAISSTNVRELREHGSTWLHMPGEDETAKVHVVLGERELEIDKASPASTATPLAIAFRPPRSRGYDAYTEDSVLLPGLEAVKPLPKFEFVLFLSYRQEWLLAGFARGDLVNTIALAPQEETTVDVFSWDRQRRTLDVLEETGWESTLEAQATGRITREVAKELTENEAWKLTSAGIEIGIGDKFKVGADLSGNFGTETTEVTRRTRSRVEEATAKAATKARGLRQTKVSESREFGFEQRTTRRLRNQNLCRSVAYDFFEVLAAYDVHTHVVPESTRLGVLVPSPLPLLFNRATIIAFEGTLRGALLDSHQAAGFDAARWLAARDEYCSICREQPCCPCEKPKSYSQADSGSVDPAAAAARVLEAGDRVAFAIQVVRLAVDNVGDAWDAGITGDAFEQVVLSYRQFLFRRFGLESHQPAFWSACLRFESEWPSNRKPERVAQLISEATKAWRQSVGDSALAQTLLSTVLPRFLIQIALYHGFETLWYSPYTGRGFDDAALGSLLTAASSEVGKWEDVLDDAALPTTPPVLPSPAPESAPATEPYGDDKTASSRVAERSLIAHLEANRSHYLEAIWRSIQPADRARITQSAFGKLGSDVEYEILGFYGDKVVLPFNADQYSQLRDALKDAIERLREDTENDSGGPRVILPTEGVEIHARLDECDGCEPFVLALREYELAERKATAQRAEALAEQAALERDRLQARLDATPPQLDDPTVDRPQVDVRLINRSSSDSEPG